MKKFYLYVVDWYTKFCKLEGVDSSDSGLGKFPVEGLDVWPIISGENTKTQCSDMVLSYNFGGTGAIIMGEYNLIVVKQPEGCDSLMWTAHAKMDLKGKTVTLTVSTIYKTLVSTMNSHPKNQICYTNFCVSIMNIPRNQGSCRIKAFTVKVIPLKTKQPVFT